jgi:dihydrofolate reductase
MTMSLDGFVCGPSGENEWQLRSRGEKGKAWVFESLSQAGLIAMGSRSFHAMAGFWQTSNDLLAPVMNGTPKVVFTRQPSLEIPQASPTAGNWAEPRIANGDLAAEVHHLIEESGKDIIAIGGAGFAQSLTRTGLIDEYRLLVHPVAIGAGRSIFAELPKHLELQLMSTTVFGSGVTAQIYRPG